MRIEPRQQLLETWAATVRSSWRGGVWYWGGRDGSNSIADAEQLLCILLPATRVQPLALDRPDSTSEGVRTALAPLGDANDIPVTLVRIATQYFERYAGPDGHPVFAGGSYFGGDELHDWQREREVVDSFAVGLTLSLTVLGFLRIFQPSVRRAMLQEEVRRLERLARARLTAAMVGLLRSFSTDVFDADSEPGQTLIATVNRNGRPARQVVSELRTALRETIASFDEVLIGSGQTVDLGPDSRLFACGWSWGVVADAPQVYLEDTADIDGRAR
ncbi:SCO2524 family protein [Actinoplanes sp. NPDC051513]|uniref:SCO2524 family protein n=1 Tax=Actinoplanes sp. NPDC051513 TaxID=3363908 RepID=UPI0037AE8B47